MKKPTVEKKLKTVAKKVRAVPSIEKRVERANELLSRQYDSGTEMLHQCREAAKMVLEACATVHAAEQHLAETHTEFKNNGFVTRKQLIKYILINLALTAAFVMVAAYGAK